MKNIKRHFLVKMEGIGKKTRDIRKKIHNMYYGDINNYSMCEYVDSKKYEFEFIGHNADYNKEIQLKILNEHELDNLVNAI